MGVTPLEARIALEVVAAVGGEVGLVLLDGVALVVPDGAAVADPARVVLGVGLGLHLAQDLLAVARGVRVALLPDGGATVVDAVVGVAVDGGGGGAALGVVPGGEIVFEVGGGVGEGVAVGAAALAHLGHLDDHAELVEGDGDAVAVGVGGLVGAEDAVVVVEGGDEVEGGGGVGGVGLGGEQIVGVEDDLGAVAEGLGDLGDEVEVVGVVGGDAGDGPVVGTDRDVAGVGAEDGAGDGAAVDAGDEAPGEGEREGVVEQGLGLDGAEGESGGEIVLDVDGLRLV